jgi:hypothetical protein
LLYIYPEKRRRRRRGKARDSAIRSFFRFREIYASMEDSIKVGV